MKGFDGIAKSYDDLWFFSDDYQNWMLNKILSYLMLGKNDLFADIGGGTGVVTEKLKKSIGLNKSPYCVEPSAEMIAEAKKYKDLICVNQEAEQFVVDKLELDKVLIKESIHHVRDRVEFWNQLYAGSPNARVLVITRPQKPGFPLFEEAYRSFSRYQPSIELLEDEIKRAGLFCKVFKESWEVSLPKGNWFDMLRARFISDLFEFSDDEIEAGISELSCRFQEEDVSFSDELVFIMVSKFDDV